MGAESQTSAVEQPEWWLYVSRRLDLRYLPNAPIWSLPTIRFGSPEYGSGSGPESDGNRWFYRLTAGVVAWLEKAGEGIERTWEAAAARDRPNELEAARGQVDAYLAAMNEVWEFAARWIPVEAGKMAREEARAGRVKLPEVEKVDATC